VIVVFASRFHDLHAQLATHNELERLSKSGLKVDMRSFDGNPEPWFSFDALRGRLVLVVNSALKGGFSPGEFADLAGLMGKMKGDPFTVVMAPCGQFQSQEIGHTERAYNFLVKELAPSGGSFVVLKKLQVNGDHANQLYRFLKRHSLLYDPRRGQARPVPSSSAKFLVDANGCVLGYYGPRVRPRSMERVIKKHLLDL